MTGGISNSLNLVFSRINTIENDFAQLQNISNQVQNSNTIEAPVEVKTESDFKTIFDEKMREASLDSKINTEQQKTDAVIDELTLEPKKAKEAVTLKSKIDLKSQTRNIDEIVETFADKYNLDGDFIKAIIKQESGFNPYAKSKKGAMGLMQLMPKTAQSLGVVNAYNPWENVEGGVKYLKGLMERFNNDEKLALAAYNAGPNAVKKYGGVPPYKETQNYVNSIMNSYNKIKGARL